MWWAVPSHPLALTTAPLGPTETDSCRPMAGRPSITGSTSTSHALKVSMTRVVAPLRLGPAVRPNRSRARRSASSRVGRSAGLVGGMTVGGGGGAHAAGQAFPSGHGGGGGQLTVEVPAAPCAGTATAGPATATQHPATAPPL